MVLEAIRKNLEANGWEKSKQFPSPWSYYKDTRQINLDKKDMKLFTDKHIFTIDQIKFLSGRDSLVAYFIKS